MESPIEKAQRESVASRLDGFSPEERKLIASVVVHGELSRADLVNAVPEEERDARRGLVDTTLARAVSQNLLRLNPTGYIYSPNPNILTPLGALLKEHV